MTAGRGKRRFLLAVCLIGMLGFGALGVWQVERLQWKRALIAQVGARLAAPAVPLPAAAERRQRHWQAAEYRRVRLTGTFLHDRETLVDALTERGPGAWVLTPLRTADGVVLVNRGFVPPERKAAATRRAGQVAGPVAVTGLLRLTEPGGRFLRANRPGQDRWFSRDVRAIAAQRQLGAVAPFFVDADAAPNPGGLPIGGLTVVHFRNAHLVYALTWFGLALLSLAGLVLVLRTRHDGR